VAALGGFLKSVAAELPAQGAVDRLEKLSLGLVGRHVMAERTKYQQKIIKNYYQNHDAIVLQRLGEQVTELFLAEGKARARIWERVRCALEKLKVPASRLQQIVKSDDPAKVARLLEELLANR
jgi:hypothetical protein